MCVDEGGAGVQGVAAGAQATLEVVHGVAPPGKTVDGAAPAPAALALEDDALPVFPGVANHAVWCVCDVT